MNFDITRKGSLAACICAPLVLYVGTWPVIEIKSTKVSPTAGAANVYVGNTALPLHGPLMLQPGWIGKVYRPLHFYHDSHAGRNVLADYWTWWCKVLNHPGAPMQSSLPSVP